MRCCDVEPMIFGVKDNGEEIVYSMRCPKCKNVFEERIKTSDDRRKEMEEK